ncbi:MAG: hypothetical protein AAB511_01485 [Patescibacteria group bacterium]
MKITSLFLVATAVYLVSVGAIKTGSTAELIAVILMFISIGMAVWQFASADRVIYQNSFNTCAAAMKLLLESAKRHGPVSESAMTYDLQKFFVAQATEHFRLHPNGETDEEKAWRHYLSDYQALD